MPLFNSQANTVLTTGDQSVAGIKTFTSTIASGSSASGAVVVAGGLGVGGTINVGGAINAGSSTSSHFLNGNVTIGSGNTSSQFLYGGVTIGSSNSNNHSLFGALSLSSSAATHSIAGGLTISKPLTTAGRKSALLTKSANYTTVATDEFILIDATGTPKTITLLAAATAGAGATITIIKIDASTSPVTITPVLSGGTLTTQYQSANFVSNGTSWYSY